ncbi:MAG TPA: sigma-70 family RNA polymerase sigma factor [Isosphaeraceae bacterium]|nr:sigma-70 family RNA polymerase sigma factor [Isosphaeraceae bacterium]
MAIGRWGSVLRRVHTLLDEGVVGGLSDRELLERYRAKDGATAEPAFASLVERHGPMVLRVCRSVLRDAHEAQDAFQATFLILARKAGSLWVHDSLGPWLYRVAYRTSAGARSAAARRKAHERKAAEEAPRAVEGAEPDDLGPVLHEEVNRLPARYRAAIVLCYFEGLTHEVAARRLNCPVGTVRSRLATGRDLLRGHLERRGLGSSSGMLAAALSSEATTSVPAALVETTVRSVLGTATSTTAGLVSASVMDLARKGLKGMVVWNLKAVTIVVMAIGGGAIGLLAMGQRGPSPPQPTAPAVVSPGPATPRPRASQPVEEPEHDRPAKNPKWRTLAAARINVAREILNQQMELLRGGEIGFEPVLTWSHRLMQARLSLATTPAERLTPIREHRERIKAMERQVRELFERGQTRQLNVMLVRYHHLEADQLLAEAGGDPDLEVPPAQPKPAQESPPRSSLPTPPR